MNPNNKRLQRLLEPFALLLFNIIRLSIRIPLFFHSYIKSSHFIFILEFFYFFFNSLSPSFHIGSIWGGKYLKNQRLGLKKKAIQVFFFFILIRKLTYSFKSTTSIYNWVFFTYICLFINFIIWKLIPKLTSNFGIVSNLMLAKINIFLFVQLYVF